MSIYYQDDHVTLHHGNCLEILDWTQADVLVTDPPYGMGIGLYQSKWAKDAVAGDHNTAARDTMLELWENSGTDKPAIIFGTPKVQRPHTRIRAYLVWDKGPGYGPGMGDTTLPWGISHEEIYITGKGFTMTHGREGSVLTHPGYNTYSRNRPDHPTSKPVGLMERLIQKTPPGTIADPFAGSGATLIAARNLGRQVIGVELEEHYCELIATRLSQTALNLGETK